MSLNNYQALFKQGADSIRSLPKSNLDEIAIIGRSNVGKSTFLNTLARNSKLSRVSGTPGRTQEINFFEFAFSSGEKTKLLLADLPGYGFARFSKDKREKLSKLTVDYIHSRKQLQIVCLLNDCRREPESEEFALRDLIFNSGKTCLVVLTKCDKLGRGELEKRVKSLSAAYRLEASDFILSSNKYNPVEFWNRVSLIIKI